MSFSETTLPVDIYADGADLQTMVYQASKPWVKGLTTNPSLMRKAGITDYSKFACDVLQAIRNKPISFEVFSDNHDEMVRQAMRLSMLGENVYVKIPIINSAGAFSGPVIQILLKEGVKLNITAILTIDQIVSLREFTPKTPWIWSIFCGRISDTGTDPMNMIRWARRSAKDCNARLLWASTRHVYNLFEAVKAGADIITVPADILDKAERMIGYDLAKLSLETVQMFARDSAGYTL